MTYEEDLWDGSEYADNSSMQYRQALEAIARIDVSPYGRVLDIGCGNGAVTKYLSEQIPAGQVVGVDGLPIHGRILPAHVCRTGTTRFSADERRPARL